MLTTRAVVVLLQQQIEGVINMIQDKLNWEGMALKEMVKRYVPIASSIEEDVIVSYSRRTIVPEESYERSIRLLDEPQNEYPEGTRDYTFDVCEYIEDHAISKW